MKTNTIEVTVYARNPEEAAEHLERLARHIRATSQWGIAASGFHFDGPGNEHGYVWKTDGRKLSVEEA